MIRRGLAMLAICGFAVGQLAAVPHAHAPHEQARRHSMAPHLHLSWLGGERHDHAHPGCDDEAHHDHGPAPHRGSFLKSEHDDDAIYLSPVVAGRLINAERAADMLTWSSPASPQADCATANDIAIVASSAWREPRPDLTGGCCALYLTLRTLRI